MPDTEISWLRAASSMRAPVRSRFRFSSRIPLPASREPPEALAELPNIGIAIPGELCRGWKRLFIALWGLQENLQTTPLAVSQ